MTTTILQRIHLLAESPINPLLKPLTQILRQLDDADKTPTEKAHGVTAVVMKLVPATQERILTAIEGLAK